MALSTLATLNFSLAFIIGLLATPLSFVRSAENNSIRWATAALMNTIAPPMVAYTVGSYFAVDIGQVLRQASFGWNVWGVYTPVVIWAIWWPAWTIGVVNVLGTAHK